MKVVGFSLEEGNKYYGTIDGERFFVGTRVAYEGRKGLMNNKGTSSQRYDRAAFRDEFGRWADFIHPTAMAEGGLYHTLNTYDRARFTFSFLQFAAHVPNGDFVAYLRALLALPLAAEYFPDLTIRERRIHRVTEEGVLALESDSSTAGLMDFLNPSSSEVEDTEVIQAAKLVHWAQHDFAHRRAQVEQAVSHIRAKLAVYAKQYGLDGMSDVICAVVSDIRHQGRARSPAIAAALQSQDPLDSLLAIGEPQFHPRLVTLRREIGRLVAEGTFGGRVYSLIQQDFIEA